MKKPAKLHLLIAVCLIGLLLSATFVAKRNSDNLRSPLTPATKPSPVQKNEFVKDMPPITLDRIFTKDHTAVLKYPEDKKVTLIATGDIIPARSVNYMTIKSGTFTWPFAFVADFLRSGDLTFASLEAPLIQNCPVTNEGMVFCGDARHIEGLTHAGIDVVSIANNHYGNHGLDGINESNSLLGKNGIAVTGNNTITYREVKGTTFAFVGYNEIGYKEPGIAWMEEDTVRREIREAKTQADVVIAAFHWGVEYTTDITRSQRDFAHLAIDSGADLVLGNHPHWIQPVEIYRGKLIAYAHGNFIFDQMWSEATRLGVAGKYTFYEGELVDVQYFPVQIDDYGQAHFLEDSMMDRVLIDFEHTSRSFK